MDTFSGDIKNSYLATGVGSLPFKDPVEAVNFVFDTYGCHIPYWPQLPKKTFNENMYVQFSERLPGVTVDEANNSICVNTQSKTYLSELEETFNKYNEACKTGNDADFGRAREHMKAFEPPFHAVKLWPALINTQGGPRRDKESRVLDPDGKLDNKKQVSIRRCLHLKTRAPRDSST